MFCPGCGATNSVEQRFCRACGMNLEQSALSLREQFPDNLRADLQREEKKLERFGSIAFGGFGVVAVLAVCGIIYWIAAKMIFSGEQPLAGILFIAFLVFAALTLTYVARLESLKEKRQRIEKAPGLDAAAPAPTAKLLDESSIEPVPTVVEDTTELLNVDRPNREQ